MKSRSAANKPKHYSNDRVADLVKRYPAEKINDLMSYLKDENRYSRWLSEVHDGEIFFSLFELVDYLQDNKVSNEDIIKLLPQEFKFSKFSIKYGIAAEIEKRPILERIKLCENALQKNHPLGHIMFLQRGMNPCHLGHGALFTIDTIHSNAKSTIKSGSAITNLKKVIRDGIYHKDTLKMRISNCKDIDYIGGTGITALNEAIICDRMDCVKLLLEYGANPNVGWKLSKERLIEYANQFDCFSIWPSTRLCRIQIREKMLATANDQAFNGELSPLQVAIIYGNNNIQNLLKDALSTHKIVSQQAPMPVAIAVTEVVEKQSAASEEVADNAPIAQTLPPVIALAPEITAPAKSHTPEAEPLFSLDIAPQAPQTYEEGIIAELKRHEESMNITLRMLTGESEVSKSDLLEFPMQGDLLAFAPDAAPAPDLLAFPQQADLLAFPSEPAPPSPETLRKVDAEWNALQSQYAPSQHGLFASDNKPKNFLQQLEGLNVPTNQKTKSNVTHKMVGLTNE